MRWPMLSSFSRLVITRTYDWVVEISRPSAVGSSTPLKVSSFGTTSCSSAFSRRCGR